VIAPGAKPLDLFRIRPDCVYRGLAQSVAAVMLTEAGWKIPEVVEALGLPRFPIRYHRAVTATFEYTLQRKGEPLVLDQDDLPTTSAIVCPPSVDPARCPRMWYLAEDGSKTKTPPRALKGCFWPRHLSAGRVVDWGMPYPAICVVRKLLPPRHLTAMVESTEDRFRLSYLFSV
jgi:hypothetical protein